eukprot:1323897-Alexandrium_andersonii.AAC.1
MRRNAHNVAGPSGQARYFYPEPSLGGRGRSSPNGPISPPCGLESESIGARFARRLRSPDLHYGGSSDF